MSALGTAGAAIAADAGAERREIVAVAKELAERELLPRAAALDESRPGAREEAWGLIREVGFDRALLGAEEGGAGLDLETLLPCLEEIATGDGGVALLVLLANAALAALPPELAAEIGDDDRWALLPFPAAELPTAARIEVGRKRKRAVLEGALDPALGAAGADRFVIAGRAAAGPILMVPAGADGVSVEPTDPQLGLRAAAPARVGFAGVRPVAEASAEQGPARAPLTLLRAGAASIARGIARRARAMALAYASERVQGGVPIIEHDAVHDMLTAMTVRLAASPPGPYPGDAETTAAKVAAADAAVATATDAVQVFGGTGYMHETGVEKLMRDAKTLQRWPEPSWIAAGALLPAAA